jgi:hypothetical protein
MPVQWEASARSTDHPAHGELLNMPTYDVVRNFLAWGLLLPNLPHWWHVTIYSGGFFEDE